MKRKSSHCKFCNSFLILKKQYTNSSEGKKIISCTVKIGIKRLLKLSKLGQDYNYSASGSQPQALVPSPLRALQRQHRSHCIVWATACK